MKSEAAHLWRSWSKVTIEAEILKYSTEEAELRTDAAKLKTDAGKLKTDGAKLIEMADQQIVIAGRLTDSATKLDSKADELSDQAADAAAKSIQAKQRLNRLVEAEPTKGEFCRFLFKFYFVRLIKMRLDINYYTRGDIPVNYTSSNMKENLNSVEVEPNKVL